jgi:ubiquinone/menaquinone biosynthesis C-methylase UbiE
VFEAINEAFSRQSNIFDEYEKRNETLKWMRSVTHEHVMKHLKTKDKILELNSGTGIDAVFFSSMGIKIHCTDVAEGMINKLAEKVNGLNLSSFISYQKLSFTELDRLNENSFDYIFSNFGGINCAPDLNSLFRQFNKILKAGGRLTFVIMPPICPWEIALAFRGKFKTAFRRFNKRGLSANVEGIRFPTYYYSITDVIKALGKNYQILDIQGLGSFTPPPYMENFPKRHVHLYKLLKSLDEKYSRIFPFNRFADHFILTAEYKGETDLHSKGH